jgi:hypothetical protein
MEDNNEKMNPTRDLYEKLISEVYKYKLEEREMALDRYRRADEQMDSSESFILMGKNAIDFLKQAASSSDGIEKLAKEIKSIVYKEDASSNVEVSFNDTTKKGIIDAMRAEEAAEREAKKNISKEDLTDNDRK